MGIMRTIIDKFHTAEAMGQQVDIARAQEMLDALTSMQNLVEPRRQELNDMHHRLRRLPTLTAHRWDERRLLEEGVRFYFLWVGGTLFAVPDHGELLGRYNKRSIENPTAHLPYRAVKQWVDQVAAGRSSLCNDEGWPLVHAMPAKLTFMLDELVCKPQLYNLEGGVAMEHVAEWLAKFIDPESLKENP